MIIEIMFHKSKKKFLKNFKYRWWKCFKIKMKNVNKIKIGSEIYISLGITQIRPLQKWYSLRKSTLKWALIKHSLRKKIHGIMAPGKMFAWSPSLQVHGENICLEDPHSNGP